MLQKFLLTVALVGGALPALAQSQQQGTPGGARRLRTSGPKVLQVCQRGPHAGAGMFASQSCQDRRCLQQGPGQPRAVTACAGLGQGARERGREASGGRGVGHAHAGLLFKLATPPRPHRARR